MAPQAVLALIFPVTVPVTRAILRKKSGPRAGSAQWEDAWEPPIVKQGQEVLWPPIVRIPEWRVRAGGVQWPVMPSKGDAGRCRGVYVAHKSDTARDASRRERNFPIGKSCESPRLKGVPFIKRMLFNHLAQRWVQARTEQGSLRQLGLVQAQQTLKSPDGRGVE